MDKPPKNILIHIIILCAIVAIAFFPAYLWEQPHLAWVGQLITIVFALVCYIPWLHDRWKYWYMTLVALIVRWFFIESIGVMTWLPYGQFAYGKTLWPTIATWVPYMLAMTWPPLVLGIWSLIQWDTYIQKNISLAKQNTKRHLIWPMLSCIVVGTLSLLAVDIILDPIAVAMQLWTYAHPWWRGGVPLSNFGGRLISGSIAMIIVYLCMKHKYIHQDQNKHIPTYTMLRYAWWLIYTLVFFVSWYIWKIVLF